MNRNNLLFGGFIMLFAVQTQLGRPTHCRPAVLGILKGQNINIIKPTAQIRNVAVFNGFDIGFIIAIADIIALIIFPFL